VAAPDCGGKYPNIPGANAQNEYVPQTRPQPGAAKIKRRHILQHRKNQNAFQMQLLLQFLYTELRFLKEHQSGTLKQLSGRIDSDLVSFDRISREVLSGLADLMKIDGTDVTLTFTLLAQIEQTFKAIQPLGLNNQDSGWAKTIDEVLMRKEKVALQKILWREVKQVAGTDVLKFNYQDALRRFMTRFSAWQSDSAIRIQALTARWKSKNSGGNGKLDLGANNTFGPAINLEYQAVYNNIETAP
jgi:hypothetical protein